MGESPELLDFTPPSASRAYGNSVVVMLFKKWLEIAERGKLSFAAITVVEPPQSAGFDFAGATAEMPLAIQALAAMQDKIAAQLKDLLPPEQDASLGPDYYVHNVAIGTIGYDVAFPLIAAEMDRRRAGCPGPLKVAFWQGGDKMQSAFSVQFRKQMFENVVRKMLPLLDAVEDPRAMAGPRGGLRLKEITDNARKGEAVPKLKASTKARITVASWFIDKERPVTVTLREAEHYPHRNSDLDLWLAFVKWLQANGETVVIVRDTAKADEPLPINGYLACSAAAHDIDIRLALYEHAKMNFFGSNGPCALGWFGHAPFRCFIELNDRSTYFPDTRFWWRDTAGIDPPEQLPWFSPQQRIVWEKPTEEGLHKVWESRDADRDQ